MACRSDECHGGNAWCRRGSARQGRGIVECDSRAIGLTLKYSFSLHSVIPTHFHNLITQGLLYFKEINQIYASKKVHREGYHKSK